METNYNYFKIDTADIWEYERALFLNGKSSKEHAGSILSDIQLIITNNASPVFGLDNYDRGDQQYKKYYESRVTQFTESLNNTEELYRIEFFFMRDGCYQYDYSIILTPSQKDFEFWFALKLRQYENKISTIDDFLTYQLQQSFNDDVKTFSRFLNLNIRQYRDSFFNEKITDTVSEWMDDYKTENKESEQSKKQSSSNTDERKIEGEIHSLLLKKLVDNPKYFQDNINEFTGVLVKLKNEQFVHQSTDLDVFKAMFRNKKITSEKRIVWIGTVKELQWFMKYLVYESKKVADLKND
ncbi:MAG: hypothetical protein JKY53_10590, partial [Flavobacteriales bacterium]|nr:hypothetical protein [Flavobacteriales bacterium]